MQFKWLPLPTRQYRPTYHGLRSVLNLAHTSIASTLISRLMLNIRDPKNSDIHGSTVNPISSIAFNHPDELSTEDDDYY